MYLWKSHAGAVSRNPDLTEMNNANTAHVKGRDQATTCPCALMPQPSPPMIHTDLRH